MERKMGERESKEGWREEKKIRGRKACGEGEEAKGSKSTVSEKNQDGRGSWWRRGVWRGRQLGAEDESERNARPKRRSTKR